MDIVGSKWDTFFLEEFRLHSGIFSGGGGLARGRNVSSALHVLGPDAAFRLIDVWSIGSNTVA